MIGTILGNRYEVFFHLGGGGFGQTYLAKDKDTITSSCQWYLIKQLKPFLSPLHKTNLEKAQELFDRETKVLKDLGKHDRIPSLLDSFSESEERYIVQEFIDGCDLSRELKELEGKESSNFSEIQILIFLKNILEVLSFVHSNEIIHRDIKPSNLIRRRQDNQFVLIDFGAVKQISRAELTGRTGTRISSEIYTPREQERGKPKLCSDIYALGIVAIQAFIGSEPSIDDDTNEVDWQRRKQSSSDFANLLNTMIHEKPVNRYDSADKTLEEVIKIINQFEPDIIEAAIKRPTPHKFDYAGYWCTEANKLRDIYGYHRSAINLYDKAIDIKPKCLKAWFNRGVALRYLRRYEESIQSFETAISIKPKLPKQYFQKGVSLFADKKFQDALESFDLALRLNPLYPPVWFYKGLTLDRLERYHESSEVYAEAQKLRPSFVSSSSPL
jgi:serine/threonine protein kinase